MACCQDPIILVTPTYLGALLRLMDAGMEIKMDYQEVAAEVEKEV